MKTKTFTYQLQVTELPLNEDTIEDAYGIGATYNPDFSEDIFAREILCEMVKDAKMQCISLLMNHLVETKDTEPTESYIAYRKYLETKQEQYEAIFKTIKLVDKV